MSLWRDRDSIELIVACLCVSFCYLLLSHSVTQVISGPLAAIAVATRGKAGTQVLHISLGGAGLILVQYRETSWNVLKCEMTKQYGNTNQYKSLILTTWSKFWSRSFDRIYRNAISHFISELSGPICGVWAPNLPSRSPPQDVPHKSFTHCVSQCVAGI